MEGESNANYQDVKPSIKADAIAAAVALKRFGLQSKTCVVTGGTKGIGAAIVFELASLQAEVNNKQVSMSACPHICLAVYTRLAQTVWPNNSKCAIHRRNKDL